MFFRRKEKLISNKIIIYFCLALVWFVFIAIMMMKINEIKASRGMNQYFPPLPNRQGVEDVKNLPESKCPCWVGECRPMIECTNKR